MIGTATGCSTSTSSMRWSETCASGSVPPARPTCGPRSCSSTATIMGLSTTTNFALRASHFVHCRCASPCAPHAPVYFYCPVPFAPPHYQALGLDINRQHMAGLLSRYDKDCSGALISPL